MSLRTYGSPPFGVVVIHGGPGAGGEMAPVARELSQDCGVLEPIQTAVSLTGQIEELKAVLEAHGDLPVTLVGFSWGAWLSFLVAAHHPALVKKLVLVSSGPFEESYVAQLREARKNRLLPEEQSEFEQIIAALSDPTSTGKDKLLARLGTLSTKTDAYDPIEPESVEGDALEPQGDIFQQVWTEASEMRRSGRLLNLAQSIRCPVVAIHGDYDPHPAEGVRKTLEGQLADFRFLLLEHCGHSPWLERQAHQEFYSILRKEL